MRAPARVFVCLSFLALAARADSVPNPPAQGWAEVQRRNDVVVSERQIDGTTQVRASTRINATPLEILAVLEDDPRRLEWMARCAETRLIERRDRWNSINYTRMSVWPFQDRDVVVETRVELAPDGQGARVRMHDIETPLQGEIRGVVRMPSLVGEFVLDANETGTDIAYVLIMDFGGKVPERIERFARQFIPLETLERLREHVPAERDAYAERVAAWKRELPTLELIE
jgi:hypothetical protein